MMSTKDNRIIMGQIFQRDHLGVDKKVDGLEIDHTI
jgi:hypothetical protein